MEFTLKWFKFFKNTFYNKIIHIWMDNKMIYIIKLYIWMDRQIVDKEVDGQTEQIKQNAKC